MKKTIYLLISVLMLSLPALSQESSYSFKDTFEVKEPFKLAIESNNSDIEVIAHDSNEVIVFYTVNKKLLDEDLDVTKEELADLTNGYWRLDVQNSSNNLKIEVVNTRKDSFTKPENQIDVHFKVYTPKKTSIELISNDGDIKIQGLVLDQKCITNDGDIHLTDLQGKVYANTIDGDIFLTNVIGDLETVVDDGTVIYLTDMNIQN